VLRARHNRARRCRTSDRYNEIASAHFFQARKGYSDFNKESASP
jgi:hypothetical protein